MNDAPQGSAAPDTRPPRGALIVIAVGLVACVVAALASTGKGEGEAAYLEWVQAGRPVESKSVPIPGGKGEMQLTEARIRATGTNVSGYSLFITGARLTVSGGSPIGGGNILCAIRTENGTEVAQSGGDLRATYPRSSEDGIYGQEVPETVLMDFSSRGNELASLEVPDRPLRFTTERGVKVDWPEFKIGEERIKYIVEGKPKQDLELPFFAVWRTTGVPAAQISCRLETSAGSSTVRTEVALAKRSPPIDEEAEELKAEEREEAEEEAEEGEEG
ncbi:MAG TPA: hypothetical protein VFY69_01560 [Solirubrobacterales bacterium]|nr:hypothetical protein [Solirubrobacterales bacterium]